MSTEHPTPQTAPLMHAAANESIERMFRQECDLERQLAEVRESRIEVVEKYQAAVKEMHYAGMQRDTLAGVLRNIRSSYPHLTDPRCDCDDCNFCRPIDAALATLDPADSRTFSSTPPKL